MRRDRREFDAFVDEVGGALLHTADLLTGDPRRAERRVRRALARTFLHWRRTADADPIRLAYRALLAGYPDPWRPRPWRSRPPSPFSPSPGADDARAATLRALDHLNRVERAVAVLRWYALLDEFDTADALGLPVESVRAAEEGAAWRLASVAAAPGSPPPRSTAARRGAVVWQADVGAPYPDHVRGTATWPHRPAPGSGGADGRAWRGHP